MSDQRPPENPYGQPVPPENPYGQPAAPVPPSNTPYGQPTPPENPYGQPGSYGGPPADPHQPGLYGPPARGDARPTTVTVAAWITMVLSGLTALLFAFSSLMFVVARSDVAAEIEQMPEFQDLDVDVDSIVGVTVGVMGVLVVWSLVAVVLGVLVLRRSNVARILLVISSAVVALGALVSILSGVSALWLFGAGAVIVLLFVGGANDWFARRSTPTPHM